MRTRWAGAVLVLLLAASACSDSADAPRAGFDLDLGGTTDYHVLTQDEAAAISLELGAIDRQGVGVQVTGCVLYYPGRYLLELSLQPDVPLGYPATLYVQPVLTVGGQRVFLGSTMVDVSRPGGFAVPVGLNEFSRIAERGRAQQLIDVEGGQAIGSFSGCDAAVIASGAPGVVGKEPIDGVGIVIQPLAPPEAAAGTIQLLARQADWLVEFDPWRALTVLDGHGLELFAGRLLLPESGWILDSIREEVTDGGCYRIETLYLQAEAPGLARLLQQEPGCPPLERPDEVITDEGWEVGVYSDDTTRGDLSPFLTWFDNLTPRNPNERVFFTD